MNIEDKKNVFVFHPIGKFHKHALTLAEAFQPAGKSHKVAFTLAEVLITLGIIGVVAALTIPSLIQKYQEKVICTQLKEFYSVFSQALLTANNEHGEFNGDTIFYEYIKPYLKIQKDCDRQKGCFSDTVIKTLDGSDWINIDNYTGYNKLVLNNGALVQIFSAWDNGDAEIRVDVNGFKGPNTLGRDIFYFKIKNNTIKPQGTKEDGFFETRCNLNSTESYNGDGCTAWVLYNENLDYLHCTDLSWDGKHKCK